MISGHFLSFVVDDLTVLCSAVNVAEPDFTSHRMGIGFAVGVSAQPALCPCPCVGPGAQTGAWAFQLLGSVPRGNGLTGKSTQGKSGLEENSCVSLCRRHSTSLSRDLSHPEKGEGEWG